DISEHPSQWATIRFVAEKLAAGSNRSANGSALLGGFADSRSLASSCPWALCGHLKERGHQNLEGRALHAARPFFILVAGAGFDPLSTATTPPSAAHCSRPPRNHHNLPRWEHRQRP